MKHAKTPRSQQRNKTGSERQRQAAITHLLDEVDGLMTEAADAGMGTAARILYTAKEELVHWAVTMNFYETPQDRFINDRLYKHNSFMAFFISRIGAIQDAGMRNQLMSALGFGKNKAR